MGPHARELLEKARTAHDPTPADQDRVAAKLAARLASAGAAPAAKAAGWSLTTKLVFIASIALVGTGVYAIARPSEAPVTNAASTASAVSVTAASAVTAPLEPASASAVAPASSLPSALTSASPSTSAMAPAIALAAPSSRPSLPAPSSLAPDLEGEMRLVSAAQSAFARGDYDTGFAKLDEHEKKFPNGVLSEERTAARAIALCNAGRTDEGRARARAFLAKHASSPLAPRVRSACDAH